MFKIKLKSLLIFLILGIQAISYATDSIDNLNVDEEDVDERSDSSSDILRRRKKNKCYCNVVVKKCLRTGTLAVLKNAAIRCNLAVNGNLAVSGNAAINGSLAVNGGLILNVAGTPFIPKLGVEPLINIRGTVTPSAGGGGFAVNGAGFTVGNPMLLTTPIQAPNAAILGYSFDVTFSPSFGNPPSITFGAQTNEAIFGGVVTSLYSFANNVTKNGFTLNTFFLGTLPDFSDITSLLSSLASSGFGVSFIAEGPRA